MELVLSSDINQIELEINYHKQIAGQSIWEIGRRLNHVKENDLAHGEFINWVEKLGMNRSEAYKIMRVAKELPNVSTLKHLGAEALYLVATLPEEQKQEQLTKAEQGDPSTVRELQELKRQNKLKDEQLKQKDEQISNQSKTIEQLSNQKPEIREIEVEKIPQDYNSLKTSNNELTERLVEVQTNYEQLLSERREVDEKSSKYEQLTQAIRQAEGQLNGTQKLISNYNNLSDLLRQSNEFLSKASALVYQDLSEVIQRDGLAKQELDFLIERLEKFLSDLLNINKQTIIEGEIINE